MTKFMVLYSSTSSADAIMSSSTPAQIKACMDEWLEWKDQAELSFKVEFGLPLQATSKVTSGGVSASTSQVTGYSIIEASSKEALAEMLRVHPHLKHPGASIDIFEMLPIPSV